MWPAPKAEAQARLCDSPVIVHNWRRQHVGARLKLQSGPLLCWNEEGVFTAVTPHTAPDTEQSLDLSNFCLLSVCLYSGIRIKQAFRHCEFPSVSIMLPKIASNEMHGPLIPPYTSWLAFQSGCSAYCNNLVYALLHPLRCFFPLPSFNTNTGTTGSSGITLFDLHYTQKG